MQEITKADLKAFSLYLKNEKDLSAKTVNNTLSPGTVALSWAHRNEIIDRDPTKGLMKFSGPKTKRGILNESEIKNLFTMTWKDERSRLGNLLACSTGLRAGEVLGLRVTDIGTDRLYVRHSWSIQDRLKSTKTGTERILPLLPVIRSELLKLAEQNPHGCGPGSFIFWSVARPDVPMDFHFLNDGLKETLIRMKTGKDNPTKEEAKKAREYWKILNVVFHSWRYRVAARLADITDKRRDAGNRTRDGSSFHRIFES